METFFKLESLAIMGTGKNTGKTSFLNLLIGAAKDLAPGKVLALTSIGRDGEERDLVAGTEKPRIYIHEGTLFATSENLTGKCDVTKEIVKITDIHGALGRVIIFRALSDGYVEIAGPSRSSDLMRIEEDMREIEGNALFVVDGALSRMSFSTETEGSVLCTGVSISQSMEKIAEKTLHVLRLMTLEKAEISLPDDDEGKVFVFDGQKWAAAKGKIAISSGKEISDYLTLQTDAILFRGAVTDELMSDLMKSPLFRDLKLIAKDGTKFLVSEKIMERLHQRGIMLQVVHEIKIRKLIVNPYDASGRKVDITTLMNTLKKDIRIPVVSLDELKGERK